MFDFDTLSHLMTSRTVLCVYRREQVDGHEIVEANGGQVMLVDILPGFSTTSLVDRARAGQR
jgi:bifunctional ADP-heptose synthase (sugar kinase/adenylyltransferase)